MILGKTNGSYGNSSNAMFSPTTESNRDSNLVTRKTSCTNGLVPHSVSLPLAVLTISSRRTISLAKVLLIHSIIERFEVDPKIWTAC